MKKFLSLALFCLMALIMASCSKNTPTATVEKALTLLQKEDFRAYVDQLYLNKPNKDKEAIEKEKEQLASLLQEKYTQNPNGKISDFKVVSEEIINDSTANVTVEIDFEKGEKKTETFTCRTDEDGNWKMKQAK